jgi:hypothetical protein
MNSRVIPPASAPRSSGGASWPAALSALLMWGGLAGAGVWLVLQGLHPAALPLGDAAGPAPAPAVSQAGLTRVLAAPIEPSPGKAQALAQQAAPDVQVLGVVATPSGAGAALLKLGAEPPKPYAVGASVPGLGVVLSVTPQAIELGEAGRVTRTLQPPARKAGAL